MGEIERVWLPYIELYATEQLPPGLWRQHLGAQIEMITQNLVLTMTAVVMGKEGKKAVVTRLIPTPKFPRWLPKWLQRRWTKNETWTFDTTPLLIWPENTLHEPEFGQGVRIARSGEVWKMGEEDDG